MALCVCKCLNVSLESDILEDNVDLEKLKLTSTEQRDIFFSEKLFSCSLSSLKTQVAQQALVYQRSVDRWVIHSCLACKQPTHAISHDKNGPYALLLCKVNQTTQERINSLRKLNNYSPVFNLLVPEVNNEFTMKENVDTNNYLSSDKNMWQPTRQVMNALTKHLQQALTSQLETVEEIITQFREQKYAEFEAYRERAQREHIILASIVNKSNMNPEHESWRMGTPLDNNPLPSQLQSLSRRLSTHKDGKKMQQNIVKPNRHMPSEEDSLDAEDLFDIEGTDSQHNMLSDQDDYDSDLEGSNEEGIHISRPRGGGVEVIARSLPMNMPKFPNERSAPRDIDEYEDPQDIAASIKALARSVHGDVFELPRPRFSTQI